ncbi:uncharacterized protein LOC100890904 [Strongylocentrotus purpuratus]|uniref:C1q domain-containing protein n=1 Tax=Strongylocentrotus purpuratus TaxID=7668 RepID=A0A7M7GE72_STRPU|nr:uncharacterized protein LOC100890904 [Strongylocentrotus purpuratus]|eukprot:XP_003723337.1 PREDICTED: uncharacterized protein LOC100890904 [Strongylocentrotus purpuratus]
MCTGIMRVLFLLSLVCLTSQIGKAKMVIAQKSRPLSSVTNEIADISTEQTTSSLDHTLSDIDRRIDGLDSQIHSLNVDLKQILERTPSVSSMEEENAELRRMLRNFERFFGTLYAEKPEAFDAEANAEIRMSKLNEYLGNREAELAGLRPAPSTVIDTEETFDPEVLGRALLQITEENSKLAEKVQKLQSKVDITIPRKENGRDDVIEEVRRRRSPRDLHTQNLMNGTSLSNETLSTIKRMLAQEIASALATFNESSSTPSSCNSSSNTVYTDISDDGMSTSEEIEILTEDLLGIPTSSRRRKSAFSVASMTSLLGSTQPQYVTFEHVYVNKGRDFLVDNHTFACQIAGFYYISFNLRSYDGRHLGVTLMKNEEVMTAIYSDASSRNVMESQSLILHLERGDRVYLRLGPSETYGIYSDFRKYSTFSGFLLYRGY